MDILVEQAEHNPQLDQKLKEEIFPKIDRMTGKIDRYIEEVLEPLVE